MSDTITPSREQRIAAALDTVTDWQQLDMDAVYASCFPAEVTLHEFRAAARSRRVAELATPPQVREVPGARSEEAGDKSPDSAVTRVVEGDVVTLYAEQRERQTLSAEDVGDLSDVLDLSDDTASEEAEQPVEDDDLRPADD